MLNYNYFKNRITSFILSNGRTFRLSTLPFLKVHSTVVFLGAYILNDTSQFLGHAGKRMMRSSEVCINIS